MINIHENYSLKDLNTFGVDVYAKQFAVFNSEDELRSILNNPKIDKEKLLIIGGGSNILFGDDYKGTILKNDIKGISEEEIGNNKIMLSVGSGEVWDDVVEYTVDKNYYGIENLSLIPGSIGAAPIQNIGAYGVELKDVFHSLEGYFIDTLEKRTFTLIECKFGYRDSIFKGELKGRFIITKVNILLSKMKEFNFSYGSLKNYFHENNIADPSLQQIRDAVIKIRNSKLPDPEELGNAGSFFKNPKITKDELDKLVTDYPDVLSFPLDKENYKIAAGWLIEKVGLKGKRIGDVGTHKDQALVIVNYGEATGNEIIQFAKYIQTKVNSEFGILLEQEVNIINHNHRELL